jgi:prephenate dehydratase/prephenate dehydrogenase
MGVEERPAPDVLPATATIGVLGLGLIGGSLARDLSAAGHRVLGHDHDPATLQAAVRARVIDAAIAGFPVGLAAADVVVVATPVDAAPGLLQLARPHLGGVRLITDVGSTKRAVQDAAGSLGLGTRFVGGHPLAGEQRSGLAASRAGLFDGALVYICPAPDASREARQLAHGLWRAVGARTRELTAGEHDRLLAWTSHLPQVVSTALACALDDAGIDPDQVGAGGRGMIRLAGSSPGMWTGIALTNGGPLDAAVHGLAGALATLRAGIERGSHEQVRGFFEAGRRWTDRRRDTLAPPSHGTGAAAARGSEPAGRGTNRIAFQGEAGAFSEEAVLRYFGAHVEPVGLASFAHVARAVMDGDAASGLLPIENTVAGSILDTYDLLLAHGLVVIGEVIMPVRHCVLGLPGADLQHLDRVLSHPVALAQCARFLAAHPATEAVVRADTAGAAREVAAGGSPEVGAIAGHRAGQLYGLQVLAADVQDREDNQTRFLVVAGAERAAHGVPSPAGDARVGRRKTVLVVETPNTPGALLAVLQPFADRSINLSSLESRPTGEPWTYRFFIEVEADAAEPGMKAALDAVTARSRARVLGSFAAAPR